MLRTTLMVVHLLFSVGLIASVLLQSGRSAGLSGAIAGGAETLFGRRKGMDQFLEKATIFFAAAFMAMATILGLTSG